MPASPHDSEQNRVLRDPATTETVRRRFFIPFAPRVEISGYGAVGRSFDEDGELASLTFPVSDSFHPSDATLLLHEMGHFVTVREKNAVKEAFGFSQGIPDLGMGAFQRVPARRHSAVIEAKAIAWSTILERDLFGIEPDHFESVAALRTANDFWLYEGRDTEERLEWVAGLVEKMVAEFGTVDDFEKLWRERCLLLPDLFEHEIRRMRALESFGKQVSCHSILDGEWTARILRHRGQGLDAYTVEVVSEDGDETMQEFDDLISAERWIDDIVAYHAPMEEDELVPTP